MIHQLAADRVAIQWRSFIRPRYKHVSIDVAPNSLLAPVETEMHPSPERDQCLEAIVVRTSRLDASNLKERTRGEYAVTVRFVDSAMYPGRRYVRLVQRRRRRATGLCAEVVGLSFELLGDRCRGTKPLVELPLHGVIDQRDPDVLVAAALTR